MKGKIGIMRLLETMESSKLIVPVELVTLVNIKRAVGFSPQETYVETEEIKKKFLVFVASNNSALYIVGTHCLSHYQNLSSACPLDFYSW